MLVKEALSLAITELGEFLAKQLEARILLAHILHFSTEELLLNYNSEISATDEARFFQAVSRRKNFEPIAYIIEVKEFYGLDFLVNSDVLIPRADTENLVDIVIDAYKSSYLDKEIDILELGTGSGAIAVSLAYNIPSAQIIATDISANALTTAEKNAKQNNVVDKIRFVRSNWYKELQGTKKQFDFIVSNPPYIKLSDQPYIAKETILYEPKLALFGVADGLSSYNQIIPTAGKFLKTDGKIFLEIGFNQKEAVIKILQQYEFINIKCYQDLQGHDRVIVAKNVSLG